MKTILERFFEKVDRSGECWIWTGGKTSRGYGNFSIYGSFIYAHRFSYLFHIGGIPKGIYVLHNCPGGDNEACVNPAHLWLGTSSDNQLDSFAKGRKPTQVPRGVDGYKSVLTTEMVSMIKNDIASGMTQRIIAKRYGISQITVSRVSRGLRD